MKFPIVVFTSCPFPEPEKKAFQGWRCLSNIFSFKNLMLCWMVWLTATGVSKIRINALVKVADILWYIQWARISSFEIWQERTFWYFLSNFVQHHYCKLSQTKFWLGISILFLNETIQYINKHIKKAKYRWKNHREIIIKKLSWNLKKKYCRILFFMNHINYKTFNIYIENKNVRYKHWTISTLYIYVCVTLRIVWKL